MAFEDTLHECGFVKVHVALFLSHFAEVMGESGAKTADTGADENVGGTVYGEDVEGEAGAWCRLFNDNFLRMFVQIDVIGSIAVNLAEFGGEEDNSLVHEEAYCAVACEN